MSFVVFKSALWLVNELHVKENDWNNSTEFIFEAVSSKCKLIFEKIHLMYVY